MTYYNAFLCIIRLTAASETRRVSKSAWHASYGAPASVHPMTYPLATPMTVAYVCLLSDDGEGGHI